MLAKVFHATDACQTSAYCMALNFRGAQFEFFADESSSVKIAPCESLCCKCIHVYMHMVDDVQHLVYTALFLYFGKAAWMRSSQIHKECSQWTCCRMQSLNYANTERSFPDTLVHNPRASLLQCWTFICHFHI